MPAQLQSVAFKLPGVASAWSGKPDLDLSDYIAGQAKYPLNRQYNLDRFGADGNTGKHTIDSAFTSNGSGPALRATKICFRLINSKNHFTAFVSGSNILIATDTKSMVQKTGGHDGFPPLMFLRATMKET
jgi:hypothetical protein